MLHSNKGLPFILINGLGISLVKGFNLSPFPAAKINAFMKIFFPILFLKAPSK